MTKHNINAKRLQPAPMFLWVSFGLLVSAGVVKRRGAHAPTKGAFHDRQATIVRLRNGDKKNICMNLVS